MVLALLDRAGVTGASAREALDVLIVYAIGFAAFATRAPLMPRDGSEPPAGSLAGSFDTGLRWLLAGAGVSRRPGGSA